MREYDPFDWFWVVGKDDGSLWSSAHGTYVANLPEVAGVTCISSETELSEVLAVYGLRGPAPIIPDRVTARQFKLQLLEPVEGYPRGLFDAVAAWVATQDREVQIAFEYSGTFVRDEPMMHERLRGPWLHGAADRRFLRCRSDALTILCQIEVS